jgi:hypothetical protein
MYIKNNRVGLYSTITSSRCNSNIFIDFFPRFIAEKLNKKSKSFKFNRRK